jgi:hypothetical protein
MGSKKPLNEKASRERLIGHARKYGCEAELMRLFSTYDDLIKHAKSEEERKAFALLGLSAIDAFFGGRGDFFPVENKTKILK